MEFMNENAAILLPIVVLLIVFILYYILNKHLFSKFGEKKINLLRLIVVSFAFGFFLSLYMNGYENKNIAYHISMLVVAISFSLGIYLRAKDVLKH
jgi:multisubunit Na+/H+ antiporter MnhB subunit